MAEIIEMPKLSDTMTSGTLVKWLKQEGESVSAGDMLAEVETDKATMEMECFEDGVLLKQYIKEGDSVAIGAPICAIGEEGEEAPQVEIEKAPPPDQDEETGEEDEVEEETDPESEPEADADDFEDKDSEETDEASSPEKPARKSSDKAKKTEGKPPKETSEKPSKPAPRDKEGRIKASPLARRMAEDLKVDLEKISGTGPGGRIIREDVENAVQSSVSMGGSGGPAFTFGKLEEQTVKVSNMRASIARALVKSKREAPHFYLQSEVDAAPLAKLRQDLNGFLADLDPDEGGIKYTINDLILRAAAMAVLKVPAINRSWQGDTIKQLGSVHLAFGVAVDEGLLTPVIRDAHQKSIRQIATEARELIAKARNKKLKPDEMTGSTLTVTNLGMYGISDFYGILNPGNAAILSVGTSVKSPIVDEHNQITIGQRMKVGLSGDHRVIDGAVGALYLDALREILEKPSIILL